MVLIIMLLLVFRTCRSIEYLENDARTNQQKNAFKILSFPCRKNLFDFLSFFTLVGKVYICVEKIARVK